MLARFLYDGIDYMQEQDASGARIATELTLGPDEVIARMTSAGIAAPLSDAQGSMIAETNATQAVTTSFAYQPYGTTGQTGAVSTNSQQYTGRENDRTGLYYYRARYYSPAVGRFMSEDPIGYLAGPNVYAYVGSNPITNRDPSGECPWCTAAAVVGAAANAFNNYDAYASGEINGWQYFEDIVVGAGTGYLSGIPGGGLAVQLLLGGATAGANEGIQELVNGKVDPCKIKVAASIGMVGPFLGILGESIGNRFARPVIGNLLTAGNG